MSISSVPGLSLGTPEAQHSGTLRCSLFLGSGKCAFFSQYDFLLPVHDSIHFSLVSWCSLWLPPQFYLFYLVVAIPTLFLSNSSLLSLTQILTPLLQHIATTQRIIFLFHLSLDNISWNLSQSSVPAPWIQSTAMEKDSEGKYLQRAPSDQEELMSWKTKGIVVSSQGGERKVLTPCAWTVLCSL